MTDEVAAPRKRRYVRIWLTVILGALAVTGWSAFGLFIFQRTISPVHAIGQRVRVTVRRDGNLKLTELPPNFRGPLPIDTPSIACVVGGSGDVEVFRCEHAGTYSKITVRCEPFEIGLFNRTHDLTFATEDAGSVDIFAECMYQRD